MSATRDSNWKVFLEYLAPASGEKILDVGAGSGANAAKVLEVSGGAEVYAVDPDERRIASMKTHFPSVKGSVAGAESLPFPDSYFEKVYSTMALHHFNDPDKGLSEITRVLKKGGSFVILEVEPGSMAGRLFRFFGRLMGERMNMMSQAQLIARLGSIDGVKVTNSVSLGGRYLIRLARS